MNNKTITALLSATILSMSAPLMAASFDCRKASTGIERVICDDPKLSRLDSKMGRLYHKVKHIPGMKSKQQGWVHHRNIFCGSSDGCLIGETEDRIVVLKRVLKNANRHNNTTDSQRRSAVYSPDRGVICDRKAGFCVDSYGISLGLTGQYLGQKNKDKWEKVIDDDFDTTAFGFSNRLYCDTKKKICKKDKWANKIDRRWTRILFGR